jgi:hypothetical protein
MISVPAARPLALAFLLAACGSTAARGRSTEQVADLEVPPLGEAAQVSAEVPPPAPDPLAGEGIDAAGYGRNPSAASTLAAAPMLMRTGTATVQVDSLEVAVAQVRQMAARVGGYVAGSAVQGGREQARAASLEVKIPAARWDAALAALQPLGKVEEVSVTAEDVGEEFVDVQARVANARRLEARLLGLLERRTGKLDEVLAVERELARVREEIERYEGRLGYLSRRAAVSTLTVRLHEPRPVVGDYPGASILGEAAHDAWRNFVLFIALGISSLGFVVPLSLLALLAWRVGRRFWRSRPGTSGPTKLGIRRRPRGPALKVEP